MNNKFKNIFNKSSGDIKSKILRNLIDKNKVFLEFFELTTNGKNLYEKILVEKENEITHSSLSFPPKKYEKSIKI